MSADESAQEIVIPESAAQESGSHAAGPEIRPVPGDPVPAAPETPPCPTSTSNPGIGPIFEYQIGLTPPAGETPPSSQPSTPTSGAPIWSRRIPGKDRVAIVGFSTYHRHLAPKDAPDCETWGLNNGYVHMPAQAHLGGRIADRWFEIHSEDLYGWDLRRPGDHVGWLSKFKGPIYMIEAHQEIPTSVRYPLEDVVNCVGPYLTSGPAMMVGLAILEGFKRIELYGLDMATHTEYADQKPGLEFLLGLAMGREIEIVLPKNCDLLKGPVYGRGDLNAGGERHTRQKFEGRLKALAKRKAEQQQELFKHQLTLARIEGAELEAKYWIGQTPEGGDPARLLAQMSGAGREIIEAKNAGTV